MSTPIVRFDAPPEMTSRSVMTGDATPSTLSASQRPSATASTPASDPNLCPHRRVVDDLVEVLRQAGALEILVLPLRHALGDARDHAVTTVAQRDVGPH